MSSRYQVRQTVNGDWYIDGGALPVALPVFTQQAGIEAVTDPLLHDALARQDGDEVSRLVTRACFRNKP